MEILRFAQNDKTIVILNPAGVKNLLFDANIIIFY